MFPIAELSFTILKYFGIWRPSSLTPKWIIVYNVYNVFMIIFVSIFAMLFFGSIYQNFSNIDLVIENSFYFGGLIVLNFKMIYISLHRKDFINLKNMFLERKCIPRNLQEMSIRTKFHDFERFNSRIFVTTCAISSMVLALLPLTKGKNVSLPFKTWIPYDINSRFLFWLTYIYQGICINVVGTLFSSIEIITAIMMQQICAQLELCMHRLMELPKLLKLDGSKTNIYRQEFKIVQMCVEHHVFIYRIKKKFNDLFSLMVFIQFFSTMLSLCTHVYQLSKLSLLNLKFWAITIMLSLNIVQAFLYCWFGDIMIEKSLAVADVIYHMNWTSLTGRTKRNLLMIMLCSDRPIKLKGASMITMSVDTFVKILRTSFSAFNLLQSTS